MKRPYQTPYSFQLKLWLLFLGIMVVILLILTEKSFSQKAAQENPGNTSFGKSIVKGMVLKTYRSTIVAK